MRDLAGHLRHLLVVQTLGEVPDSFAVTAEHTDRLASQAERLSQGELLRAVDLLAAAIAAVKEGSEPRLQLEVALLKATQPQADQSLGALMFRIDQLEARAATAADRCPTRLPASGDGSGAAATTERATRSRRRPWTRRHTAETAAVRAAAAGAVAVSAPVALEPPPRWPPLPTRTRTASRR